MLTFGKQRPAHNSGSAGDVAALSSELATLSTAVGLLATKQDVPNLPDLSSELAAIKDDIALLPTKAEVRATIESRLTADVPPNTPYTASVVGMLQSLETKTTAPLMTEVQLQTNFEWPYLAVCGTNGVIHKLMETQALSSAINLATNTGLKANELLTPFSLYLDQRYRWTIVAIGLNQEFGFPGRTLIVDDVPQAHAVGKHNYLLPESLWKSDGSNRYVLKWG